MGYKVALWRDFSNEDGLVADWVTWRYKYPGYAAAVNEIAAYVFHFDTACDWIVATGDDTLPDPTKRADEIAEECTRHFVCNSLTRVVNRFGGEMDWCAIRAMDIKTVGTCPGATFGVMQPTGDPWSDRMGRIIERIAGSPWLGREWCKRANGGLGPLWPKFYHCFADETLQCVAQQLGVFWQRPDLTHMHNNWARKPGTTYAEMPPFLAVANSPEHWKESKAEFERLKASGFKECLPIP